MRISDWSSDVCSSDLALLLRHGRDFRHIRDSAIVRGMVQRGTNVLDIALDALAFDAFRCVVIVLTLPRNSIALRSRAPRDESLNYIRGHYGDGYGKTCYVRQLTTHKRPQSAVDVIRL